MFFIGTRTRKTLELLQTLKNCTFVRGNHDRYLIMLWEDEIPSMEGMDPDDPICKAIVENEKWTYNKIGRNGVSFCR